MLNLVNHPYHGTDPAKYGVKEEPSVLETYEGLRPGELLQAKHKERQQKMVEDLVSASQSGK